MQRLLASVAGGNGTFAGIDCLVTAACCPLLLPLPPKMNPAGSFIRQASSHRPAQGQLDCLYVAYEYIISCKEDNLHKKTDQVTESYH